MRETLLSPEELDLAKDSFVRSLPAEFETSARVTSSTANIYIYDLGLDYYTKAPARLSAVTAEQVKACGGEISRARRTAWSSPSAIGRGSAAELRS